ncbi:MAG: hypothetical protein DA407_04880 [Bacteroidetes bacterium]|nr:MAG: hypothetical protein DA407_04880 [Bacteroidota bacterium]
MRTKLQWVAVICLILSSQSFFAQQIENKPQKPLKVSQLNYKYVSSIAEQIRTGTFIPEGKPDKNKEINPRQRHGADIIIGKGSSGRDPLAGKQLNAQKTLASRMPSLVFPTTTNTSTPSDPTGAIGRDFYIAAWNTSWQIFNRDGSPAAGMPSAASLGTLFGGRAPGDPICLYDSAADRYILIQFDGPQVGGPTNGYHVAISETNDPINDGWHVYSPSDFGTNAFPDYEKMSIWRDGYYMTANISGNQVFALDRDKMLVGDPSATMQTFSIPGFAGATGGFSSPHFFNVTDDNLPTTGGATLVFQQDDAYAGVSTADHFKLWTLDIDWNTPGNSTISAATEFPVSAFNGVFDGGDFSNLTQPTGGPDIDALQGLIGNQAQFRKFGSHNSAVFCHVVDVGGGTEQAGIRWYELRQSGDGQPWSIYQEGTYVAPDGRHVWNGSMGMDIQGNIGMGYTTMGGTSNTMITSAYTGQSIGSSGTGIMDVSEEIVFTSTASSSNLRYADYSHLTVDPADDKQFWFVTEVFSPNRSNYVGVFQLAPNTTNDVGVISVDTPVDATLTNVETITVTVFNYGEDPASGFDVTYQVDGETLITEAFVGTLASQTSAQHTFATTVDLSTEGQVYAIMSCTDYPADEDNGNDCVTSNVTHIAANDLGITEITAPNSGEGLGSETVTVTIENFGTVDQSGFNVNYIIDGGTPVVENVAATVTAGNTISYSFTTLANLSSVGDYSFTASTLLGGDANASNNSAAKLVTHVACSTETNTANFGISDNGTPTQSVITVTNSIIISDLNVTVNLFHVNDSDLEIKLVAPNGTTEVMLSNRNGGTGDNYTNTTFDDDASSSIASGSAPFTGSYTPDGDLNDFNGLSSVGDWTLVITDKATNSLGGVLLDWTMQICANTSLSIDDYLVDEDSFNVIYKDNDQYLVKLSTSSIKEPLTLSVKNILGQTLLWKTIENKSGRGYEYNLDMSYASSGIYFVRVGNNRAGNVKRIIVD